MEFKTYLQEKDEKAKDSRPLIYLDMDGVLADYEKEADKRLGKPLSVVGNAGWKKVKKEHYETDFFPSLDPMPGAKELFSFIKQHFRFKILSATGEHISNIIKKEKATWLKKHFGGAETIFVIHSKDKAKYANDGVVLVDDREKSVKPFHGAGGNVILHKNPKQTITKLKKHL